MGDIGRNNISSVKSTLSSLNIRIISEDVGGDYGRTIDFYLETGEIRIKTIGKDTKGYLGKHGKYDRLRFVEKSSDQFSYSVEIKCLNSKYLKCL